MRLRGDAGDSTAVDNLIDIRGIATLGIARIAQPAIRDAIADAYRSPQAEKLAIVAETVFQRLTSVRWSPNVLAKFLSQWGATHGTALFVSGLVIRLHREALLAESSAQCFLWRTAAEMSELIAEDTGVDDTPHGELFASFCNTLVGDDRWQLGQYSGEDAKSFRAFVREARLVGPIEDAILMTAASESWNSAEYTYFEPRLRRWIVETMALDPVVAEGAIAYVSRHAGETERGHFLHAMNAWELYAAARSGANNPDSARRAFVTYFDRLLGPFSKLLTMLEPTP